ncbi:MAG: hypothetical protein ACRD1S_08945 [Vicinamibacterales bacterium]
MPQEHFRLRPDVVPLQWHEAVAVVQVVARQRLASGEDGPVPLAAGLALDPHGAVHVVDSPRTGNNGDGPAGLAVLLRELLKFSSSTPAALSSLADETEGSPSQFGSVEDFSKALQFFERPMSQHDLAALAARLATNQEQRRLNAELEQLTQKARVAEVQPKRQDDRSDPRRAPFRRKSAIAALSVAFLTIVFVGALAGWKKMENSAIKEVGSRLVERVRSEAKAVLAGDAQPAPPQQPAARTVRPPSAQRRGALQHVNPRAILTLQAVDLPRVTAVDRRGLVEPTPDSATSVEARKQRSAGGVYIVYSTADPEVEPPILVRPQLRSEPPRHVRADQVAVIELDVDELGAVSQVRLGRVSVEQRYYAAMLVAAAKAWRFRPALRAGKPVRYRLQLGLTH